MGTEQKNAQKRKTEIWLVTAAFLVIGLLLLIWPAISSSILCYLLGALCCGYGIVQIVSYFNRPVEEGIERRSFAKGLGGLIVGLVLFVRPDILAAILPTIFGAILIAGGVYKLQIALDFMRMGAEFWYLSAVAAAIICTFGIITIVNPFAVLFGLDAVHRHCPDFGRGI